MTVSADTAATTTAETTATPPAAKPPVTVADLPPEALNKRLEQAKNAARAELLADLGITDTKAAKDALAAHNAAQEAAKSRDLKLAELEVQVKAQKEALTSSVVRITSSITAEQKAAIDEVAGADPAIWLRTYNALSPTWAAPAPAAAAEKAPSTGAAAEPPPAASSSVNTPAPAPAGNVSPPNHAATYKRLSSAHPFAAAAYSVMHGDACYKQ